MKSYLYIYNPSYLLATLRTSEKDGQPPPRSASVTHAHTISSVSVAALTTEAEAIAKGELLRLRGGDSVPSGKVSTQLDASMAVLQSFLQEGGSLRALGF